MINHSLTVVFTHWQLSRHLPHDAYQLITFVVFLQTILLDVSPPRLFLILIQGTLIFDRKNLHLQAVYILVKGGTLQIGTEAEPFEQQATITLYGINL
jgi:hypothetical protein